MLASLMSGANVLSVGAHWPPSVGSHDQEARLAPLVPRYGASNVDKGAVAVFTAINLILLRPAGDFSAARKPRLLTIVGVCHLRRFGPPYTARRCVGPKQIGIVYFRTAVDLTAARKGSWNLEIICPANGG